MYTNPYMNNDGCLEWADKNMKVRLTNSGLFVIDKYGNETIITGLNTTFKQNSPTYDELYEHWLKTKDN